METQRQRIVEADVMDASNAMTVAGASQSEIRLRSYQQEMLDASLGKNIIVAVRPFPQFERYF